VANLWPVCGQSDRTEPDAYGCHTRVTLRHPREPRWLKPTLVPWPEGHQKGPKWGRARSRSAGRLSHAGLADAQTTPERPSTCSRKGAGRRVENRRGPAWLSAMTTDRCRLLAAAAQLPKLRVAGSSPVVRSTDRAGTRMVIAFPALSSCCNCRGGRELDASGYVGSGQGLRPRADQFGRGRVPG
jgi:hypothetical protein